MMAHFALLPDVLGLIDSVFTFGLDFENLAILLRIEAGTRGPADPRCMSADQNLSDDCPEEGDEARASLASCGAHSCKCLANITHVDSQSG